MFQQISIVSQQFTVLVDGPRLTHGESNVGVPIQSIDEGLQQRAIRVIVRFGEPYVFTFRLAKPQFPLLEGTAVVLRVESRPHTWVPGVRLNDLATIVRGGIVEDEELEVLKRLVQNAIEALGKIPGVIIIRRDDSDFGRVSRSLRGARLDIGSHVPSDHLGYQAEQFEAAERSSSPFSDDSPAAE